MSEYLSLSDRLADRLVIHYKKKFGKVTDAQALEDYYKALCILNYGRTVPKEEANMIKAWRHVSKLEDSIRRKVLKNAIYRNKRGVL